MATSGRLSPPRILFLPSTAYTSRRAPRRPTFLCPTFTRPTSSDSTNSFPGYAHTWKRGSKTRLRRDLQYKLLQHESCRERAQQQAAPLQEKRQGTVRIRRGMAPTSVGMTGTSQAMANAVKRIGLIS